MMRYGFGKTLKNVIYSIPIALMSVLPSCEPDNEPPTAKLEVSPIYGEVPVDVRMKVTGQDPDGVQDIKQYVLYIGSESVKSNTPIDITRTFTNEGKVNIYGEVIDSESQSNKTPVKSLELLLGPGIEQSASLINDNEISYSATLNKIASAELRINKNGNLFLTQQITDNSQTSPDYIKTFKYNPDAIIKGIYEFILKSTELEKKTSVEIPNYKPTLNLSGVSTDLLEGAEINLDLTNKAIDKNPEDMPVAINSVKSLDGKTNPSLDGYNLKIKALWDKIGTYQVELELGNTTGGLEKVVLSGNIADDPRLRVNPFVSTNEEGIAYDFLKRKSQRDSLVQVNLNQDWVDVSHIPYNPDPLWDCTQYAEQLMINFHGLSYLTGYAGENIDSIYYYGYTIKDNGKYGLPVYFVYLSGEGTEHNMNAILTGDDITKFEDWNFIEPQRDIINVQPGQVYMPKNAYIEIRAPPKKDGEEQYLLQIIKFQVENGNANLIWINEDPNLNIVKQR